MAVGEAAASARHGQFLTKRSMKISWTKMGLLYCPTGEGALKTHATRPIPCRIDDETLRIFFSSRDHDDRMLPAFVDVETRNPGNIIRRPEGFLIGVGLPGTFDDSGVTIASTITHRGRTLFYYTGWKRRRVVSFELTIGLLHWNEEANTFERAFRGPIIGQDRHHPLLVAGPFVMVEGGRFRMWYCSG